MTNHIKVGEGGNIDDPGFTVDRANQRNGTGYYAADKHFIAFGFFYLSGIQRKRSVKRRRSWLVCAFLPFWMRRDSQVEGSRGVERREAAYGVGHN